LDPGEKLQVLKRPILWLYQLHQGTNLLVLPF
ncbi:unnamed protein product, partial [marine sediment metagenome]